MANKNLQSDCKNLNLIHLIPKHCQQTLKSRPTFQSIQLEMKYWIETHINCRPCRVIFLQSQQMKKGEILLGHVMDIYSRFRLVLSEKLWKCIWEYEKNWTGLIVRLSYHEPVFPFPLFSQHRLFMFGIKFYGHEKKRDSTMEGKLITFLLLYFYSQMRDFLPAKEFFLFWRMVIWKFSILKRIMRWWRARL